MGLLHQAGIAPLPKYDVAIIGLGVVGSAIAAALSKRGLRVRGLDQHALVSRQRASWGQSRMVRTFLNDERYRILQRRAQERWASLAREQHTELFLPSGCTIVGSPNSDFLKGAASAREQIDGVRTSSSASLNNYFPNIVLPGAYQTIEDSNAGVLLAERCLKALRNAAEKNGAVLQFEHFIEPQNLDKEGAQKTADACDAHIVVLATGAWAPQWHGAQTTKLRIERSYGGWYCPRKQSTAATQRPVLIVDVDEGPIAVFPQIDGHVKVVLHHSGDLVSPKTCRWSVSSEEIEALNHRLHALFPDQYEKMPQKTAVGLYTNTPGGDFSVGWVVPNRVILASACCGKGFKFAPAVGEYVADLLQKRKPELSASLFNGLTPG